MVSENLNEKWVLSEGVRPELLWQRRNQNHTEIGKLELPCHSRDRWIEFYTLLWFLFCSCILNKSHNLSMRSLSFLDPKRKWQCESLGRVWLFVNPWTAARQAPLSVGFSRQKYWSGSTFPFPRDLPNQGNETRSPTFQADSSRFEPPGKPGP